MVRIDREKSAARIAHDVDSLTTPEYSLKSDAVCRYAYTDVYRNTLQYFARQLTSLEFEVSYDPVGTMVARNRGEGERCFAVGSHCDSNRNGGKYDGTLGIATAVEVCRLNQEHGVGLPLQLISFLEEEGSGFGQLLLGSRIIAQTVTEQDLRETIRARDDSRSFWDHAEAAGHRPADWRQARRVLDGLLGWIELHIEQGRVLQDSQIRIGIVHGIAGYVHGDITFRGRADHAGATPMDARYDAGVVAARTVAEVEKVARAAGDGTVGTVGEIDFTPGIINVVPGEARISLDLRGISDGKVQAAKDKIIDFARRSSARRGLESRFTERQAVAAVRLDEHLVKAIAGAAESVAEPYRLMTSGAAHDTMCIAPFVPSAMVFVPCRDGISHSPLEEADPMDAAVAAEIMLNAAHAVLARHEGGTREARS
jgi:allantoate deiminase